ncbi:hemerythrin domain-containing protein [Sphingomonas sp. HF-S4]|uniref:Hemerythrin domain-containing protein n=1 Tax=Sphingomonas agrestis TaxID=3080540 RepID=A0ABU3YCP9_9SPHN|nr:hemerythrin domain-containing protein [Sphingomonas sp. HF-S4]MDV3459170.1 hemerythrin domain-containing protein [Sphingomonas sp. HF-S4]
MIKQLCAEHRALEAQAALLLDIVAGEVPDAAAVAGMRWGMAQALVAHCSREDRQVYDVLLSSGDAVATGIAWRYRKDHGRLAPAFADYVVAWPVGRINREWVRFREETRKVLAGLAERIEREEHVLYSHAERVLAHRRAAA